MKKALAILFMASYLFGFLITWSDATNSPAKQQVVMGRSEVQEVLKKLGYIMTPDPQKESYVQAVKAFQRDKKLVIDGIVGLVTQEALIKEYVCAVIPEVKNLKNKLGSKAVISIERYPDGNQSNFYFKNYYYICIGTERNVPATVSSRFIIRKDLQEILRANEGGGERRKG